MNKILSIIFLILLVSCELHDIDEYGHLVPATVAQDSNLPSLSVNGTLLHAETFGDISNPMIIFLHGGPGGDYRAMISEKGKENASRYPDQRIGEPLGLSKLQDDYFLIFYDQRSAGLSQRHDSISFDDYITDLDNIIEHYLQKKHDCTGIMDEKVNLFAWSYGGILATGYINLHSEKIDNVIFYEPGPFSAEVWSYLKANTTSIFAQIGKDWLEQYLISKDHFTPDTHERADYQISLNLFRAQPEFHENKNTPLWRFGALLTDNNLDFATSSRYDISSNINKSFEGKALFLAGSYTISELPEYISKQRMYYPNTYFQEIENIGHTAPWETPNSLIEPIRGFIN